MSVRRTPFEGPLLLWMVSALLAVGISYDPMSAWPKFAFICGGVALFYLLALSPSHVAWRGRDVPLLRLMVGLAPACIAMYFLLTNDWAQPVEKAAWLEPLRQWLANRQPRMALPRLHPNLVGGALAMCLPLQVAALLPRPGLPAYASITGFAVGSGVLLLGLSGLGLLLSSLRGAWLALVMSVGMCLWWRLTDRWVGVRGRLVTFVGWAAGLSIVALVSLVVSGGQLPTLRPDRVFVWRNSLDLAWDYFFTGLGLGGFTMAYSSYALLVHVPHTTHAHNLFLDMWLEQGVVGLFAFAWLLLVAFARGFSRRGPPIRWRSAALMALLVVVLHGLVDDVYYGYGGAGTLLLFVPVALMARRGERSSSRGIPFGKKARVAMWGTGAVALAVAIGMPATRSLWEANLGALLQTRAELSRYRWPQWPLQDALRRAHRVSLAAAMGHYHAALAIDSGNVVAHRRLGQIELSMGRYDNARRHLEAAYQAAPDQNATRQLFGESLAVSGDITGAADLWRTVPSEEDQLSIRHWWYTSIDDQQRARWVQEAIALSHGK